MLAGAGVSSPILGFQRPERDFEVPGLDLGADSEVCDPRFDIRCAAVLHPALQDEDSRHAINRLPAFFNGKVRLPQEAVGFGGGEAFIPKVDREFEMLAKIFSESLDFFGLGAFGAGHAEREADNDFFDLILADDAVEDCQVVLLVLAVKSLQPLRRNPKGIGNGNAHSACAHIEAENALWRMMHFAQPDDYRHLS
jgi:hypothetical protein